MLCLWCQYCLSSLGGGRWPGPSLVMAGHETVCLLMLLMLYRLESFNCDTNEHRYTLYYNIWRIILIVPYYSHHGEHIHYYRQSLSHLIGTLLCKDFLCLSVKVSWKNKVWDCCSLCLSMYVYFGVTMGEHYNWCYLCDGLIPYFAPHHVLVLVTICLHWRAICTPDSVNEGCNPN